MPSSRQLAAIMFTDIVGYTALMGEDEQKAFDLLRKNRQLQKPIIEKFSGIWIKEIGDGILASFHTVTDAVMCAIEIQNMCNDTDDLKLRIGIHQGEVVFEDNDVFGDGVNIASRIQALAPIGGIWVSESVHKNVSNKKDIKAKFVKEEVLKNVKEPVKIYEVITNHSTEQLLTVKQAIKKSAEKSIAVLPFVNMSSDPEQEFFSDGISEEIINMLAQVSELKVIGRTSAFSFKGKNVDLREIGKQLNVNLILEGSVRKSGNKLRVTAQLISVNDGYHLWSEKFDRELKEIFEIQDEIALAILNAIKIKLLEEKKKSVIKRHTNNPEAYELYLQGRFYYAKWAGSDRYQKTIAYYNEAIEKEPGYALAYAGLAGCYLGLWFFNYLSPEESLSKMQETSRRSLALDNSIAETHVSLARMKFYYEWNFKEAETEFKKAIELNPNQVEAHEQYGILLSILGKKHEAILQGQMAIALEPFSYNINTGLGWIYWILGEYNRCSEQGKRLIEFETNFFGGHFMLGLSLMSMGKYEDAMPELQIAAKQNQGSFTLFHVGLVLGLIGKSEETKKVLNELLNMRMDQPVGNYELAIVYASLGENEIAIQNLEKGIEKREGMMVTLKQYSQLIPGFRSDPRLNILFKKIGFPD